LTSGGIDVGKLGVGTAVALGVLLLALSPAAAQEGMSVKEITFSGNRQWNTSSLKLKLSTKEGQRFSEKSLADDISMLLTFFARVTADRQVDGDGVRVSFIVEENPIVSSLIFREFSAIDPASAEVSPKIFTRRGFPFAEFRVFQDSQTLVELLKEEGRYFAEVQAAVGDYGVGRQVVFTAFEGPEVEVEEIRFTGVTTQEEDDLRDQMDTQESGLFTPGEFILSRLERDLIRLAQFYRDEGWFDAVVTLKDLAFSPDNEEVTITVAVEEGQRYVLTDIVFEGGETFPADRSQLEEKVVVERGKAPREEDIDLTRRAIGNFYLENAFYDVDVVTRLENDASTHESRLLVKITEGRPAQVRFIQIEGNIQTRDDVIRRNLSIHPGGPLDSIQLRKSLSRIENLGYFDMADGVKSRIEDTETDGEKDVVLTVKEGRTGSLQLAGAIGSESGLALIFNARKNNFDYSDLPDDPYNPLSIIGSFFTGERFTGGGQSLDLLLSPGTEVSQFGLTFTEPWFLDEYILYGPSGEIEETPFSFRIDLYHRIDGRLSYEQTRTGIGLGTGKSWRKPGRIFDDVWNARIAFAWENVRIDELDRDAPPNAYVFEGQNAVHKVSFDFLWSHVDLPAYPGEGFELDAGYMLAGGPFGGETDFHRVEAGGTIYKTLYTTRKEARHILSLTGRIGWAHEFGDTDQVPIFERFFLGGHSTIRGFDYGEVGPRASGNPYTNEGRERIIETTANGRGEPTGGEGMWRARLEYGIPIAEPWIRGLCFSDMGNVTDGFDRDLASKTRAALGVGVRFRIPYLGPVPIALDFAFPFRSERGDGERVFSFSFDRPF
jgi:outer membrane protein insertion porin family